MEARKELFQFCDEQNIQQWLKEIFEGEKIPPFDESPEFIEALKKIMNENQAAEKDAKAIIKAKKNMRDFYNVKTEELQLVTDFILLNAETNQRVQNIASVAEKIKLKVPSLSNFFLALIEIEDKELIKSEKEFAFYHHLSVFSKKIKNTMKTNEKLRKYCKSISKVVEIQKSHYPAILKDVAYFEEKKNNQKEMIKKSKERLDEINYSENLGINHSILVEKAQKLKDLEESLKTLENKLEAYHSLHPNLEGTIERVQEKENELQKLEEDLQKCLQAFENS